MPSVRKSIVIEAPASKVFAIVTEPSNWTKFVTSLVEVRDLSSAKAENGMTFTWEYKMVGKIMSGTGRVSEFEKDKSFGMVMEGRFPIKEHYEFNDRGDGFTELFVRVDFEMPSAMAEFFADNKIINAFNALEAKNVLEKIKFLCEA